MLCGCSKWSSCRTFLGYRLGFSVLRTGAVAPVEQDWANMWTNACTEPQIRGKGGPRMKWQGGGGWQMVMNPKVSVPKMDASPPPVVISRPNTPPSSPRATTTAQDGVPALPHGVCLTVLCFTIGGCVSALPRMGCSWSHPTLHPTPLPPRCCPPEMTGFCTHQTAQTDDVRAR